MSEQSNQFVPNKEFIVLKTLPEGFAYKADFLSDDEEAQLLKKFGSLPFHAFEFQGFIAKRRVVEYGWEYDFGTLKTAETDPIPEYLIPLRRRVAEFAEMKEQDLVEAIVTEYPPGAPIGWHRDVPRFEDVIGVSLLSSCRMRFKPYQGDEKPISITLEPRSIYVLRGPARWDFQHSIPAVKSLRYSITFRSLRKRSNKQRTA
jgi:alkylated DNA repair dioxygenase AlkB